MSNLYNFMWFDPDKETPEEEIRKKSVERAKSLYENMEDFRADAFRYFLIVDYKFYSPEREDHIQKDVDDENSLLTNPYLTLNVTSSCIETIANKIAKIRPKPTFLTKDADREKRELARKLDNWSLKILKKGKGWKQASKAFKSACICGLGIVKLQPDKYKKIKFDKVPVFQFFSDNAHTGDTIPTEAGECKSFTLYELIKMFPTKKELLIQAHGDQVDQQIRVFEIFKQYTKHFIGTEQVTLKYEKWDKPLPYQLFKFEEADQGVVSVGISKKLYAIQGAITYILGKTFQSVRNFAVPRVFIGKGQTPTVKEISNLVGEIVEVAGGQDGKPPVFSVPPATHPQVLDILLMLWAKAFEVIGVSQLSAGGQVPRGLEKASGAALRAYQQTESERFQLIRSDYEDAFVNMTKLAIKLVNDKDLPDDISRSAIMEARDNLSIWTSSILAETPAGRLAQVGDLYNTGIIKPDQALSLIDSPDTSKFMTSETSRIKAVDLLLERGLEAGKKPVYYAELGLDMYLERARKLLGELIVEDEDQAKIGVLIDCIRELETKVSRQTAIAESLNRLSGGGPAGGAGGPPQQTNQNEPLGLQGY